MHDKSWCEEALEIETSHVQCLSLILLKANRIQSETWMMNNPIEIRKIEHGMELELPKECFVPDKTQIMTLYLQLMSCKLS